MTLIFTADDYGAYKEIDDGVISAIDNGWLNSVAILSNGHDMDTSVKKILPFQKAKRVDLGCHFTINSGRAMSEVMRKNEHFTHKGHFRPYFNMNIGRILSQQHIQENRADLKAEIMAQIDGLRDRGIDVKHLSSHFNTLSFYEDFFEAQCEVLALPEYENIKIRSTVAIPKFSKIWLPRLAKVSTIFSGEIEVKERASDIHSKDTAEYIDAMNRAVLKYGETNRLPKMPDSIDAFHYQKIGSLGIGKSTRERKARKQSKKILEKVLESTGTEDKKEFLFHLADPVFMSTTLLNRKDFKNYLNNKYSGVTPKYMDNRYLEYQSLENFNKISEFELDPQPWSKI
jgi:predicted glycoside hydrolase/deacetylase ChbG (UPF0249 family)